MRYIVDVLYNKTVDAALVAIAIAVIIFYGTVITIADIIDIVFGKR